MPLFHPQHPGVFQLIHKTIKNQLSLSTLQDEGDMGLEMRFFVGTFPVVNEAHDDCILTLVLYTSLHPSPRALTIVRPMLRLSRKHIVVEPTHVLDPTAHFGGCRGRKIHVRDAVVLAQPSPEVTEEVDPERRRRDQTHCQQLLPLS